MTGRAEGVGGGLEESRSSTPTGGGPPPAEGQRTGTSACWCGDEPSGRAETAGRRGAVASSAG